MAKGLPKLSTPLLLAVASVCVASLSGMAWVLKASPAMAPMKPLELVKRTPVEPPAQKLAAVAPAPPVARQAPMASVFNPPPRAASDQKSSPGRCSDDPDCLRRWFTEYRGMITEELLFWRDFEDVIANENRVGATAALKSAADAGRYKHQAYDYFRGTAIANVAPNDLTAVIDDCRAAVVNMAHLLADMSHGAKADEAAPGHYLRNARKCEKQFRLASFKSELRASSVAAR